MKKKRRERKRDREREKERELMYNKITMMQSLE